MNVLFISDFSLEQNKGGAQQSNHVIIEHGKKIGHSIKLHDISSSPVDFIYKYDVIISSNLNHHLNRNNFILNKITNHPFHVRLEHDMNSYMRQDARKLLFSSSKKNIFLTQFHLDCFKKEYGDYFNNSEIIYDPIDKNIFFNKNLERENCVVYAGFLHPLKGVFNLIDFAKQNPSLNIKVYGFFETGLDESIFSNIQNITFFGLKTQLELSEIFNTHKYIFHKPNVIEPFCRMIGEALICGMEPICNDRVGSLIEFNKIGYDIFKQKCNNAEIEFWNLIESL